MHGFTTAYISRGSCWVMMFIQCIWSIVSFYFWINKKYKGNKILNILIHFFFQRRWNRSWIKQSAANLAKFSNDICVLKQDSMNFKYLCQSEIKSIKLFFLCSGLACMYTNYLNNQQSKVINIPTMFSRSASTYKVRYYFNFCALKIFVY